MPKILSQAGNSLADIYDVEGSIAGIDTLETRELPILHEMGATVFSERFRTTIRRITTGAIAQNIDFNIELTNLPAAITRLLGLVVFSDNAGRALRCVVSALSSGSVPQPLEIPIWLWDADAANPISTMRYNDNGAGVAAMDYMHGLPESVFVPNFTGGSGQTLVQGGVEDIVMRGTTAGFGAGTVTISAVLLLGFTFQGGVDSRGLPIPSW